MSSISAIDWLAARDRRQVGGLVQRLFSGGRASPRRKRRTGGVSGREISLFRPNRELYFPDEAIYPCSAA